MREIHLERLYLTCLGGLLLAGGCDPSPAIDPPIEPRTEERRQAALGTGSHNLVVNPPVMLAVGDEYALPAGSAVCERTLTADVVALDQVLFFNRLGAFMPTGMIYALRRDVVPVDGHETLEPGFVTLRPDKRPRPLVLRMNVGDCLAVTFTNLLAPERVNNNQPATRNASMHVDGLSLVGSIASAGSHVGANPSSLAAPGESRVYTWYAAAEGVHVIRSAAALAGGEGNAGHSSHGLFGGVFVEPRGSVWYRSQVTAEELDYLTIATGPEGHRRLDYDAAYPAGHAFAGLPVAAMLAGAEIVHGDLNAVITDIPDGTYPPVAASAPDNGAVTRNRNEPFREFGIFYHDENGLVQAFDLIEEKESLFHSVRDAHAINYGTGGIGAAILSVGPAFPPWRNAVGPAAGCNDCKYEEFFLSSWTLGDPATVVTRQDATTFAAGGAVAALYPDDPSNVHHSYLNDHVRMRILHAGAGEHHVHHLHAHQWLHTQNSDDSTYFDSQALGPGATFTLDISYNGSGNRNKTIGDSLFHCHLYPHFAQGMWSLWRVHDVFKDGTRVLPDAELAQGTPIPAVVPLPHLALPPLPSANRPGYPFFIPGVPGHRPPAPPLDVVHDGGLPRHVVVGGTVQDGLRGPFDRIHQTLDAIELPDGGTALEQEAMAFHAIREHASVTPTGDAATFVTNGLPPVAGAPFADPCVDDAGAATGQLRTYKAAAFQLDATFNKAGWHFPQTRMLSLWGDVADFQSGARPPEPFFFRAQSGDCIEYHHTNLIPSFYEADDFQVFTPTDVLGQHIHLVKFDVTSSDGASNGWNYEDGTLSPDEVLERIEAINAIGGLQTHDGSRRTLAAEPHPFFGVPGAQTTIQRWWADPLLNLAGDDRTLRTVFTHDHFSPSTHQQAGLYAGLVVEPAGSTWRDPETGDTFGTRFDGGPTSWRADILTADPADSFREFALLVQDFTLAYTAAGEPVNPPGRKEVGLPHLFEPPDCPQPEAVSADDVGTMTVNYRQEPLALRVRDPDTNLQARGLAGDLSWAFSSRIERADPALNVQPGIYPPLTAGVGPKDPFTPLLRAYEGDRISIRLLGGSHEEGHNISIHGLRWLHEPSEPTSGYRNAQLHMVSEHFELELGGLPDLVGDDGQTDFLYQVGAATDDLWAGLWGILRAYGSVRGDLLPLPSNPDGKLPDLEPTSRDELTPDGRCPTSAPVRRYDVTAVRAADALPGGRLTYNAGHGLHDPAALLYVLTSDLEADGTLSPDAPVEPLILRARAGECIRVTLRNQIKDEPLDPVGVNALPMLVPQFNMNQIRPSSEVGLHPQLVSMDVHQHNGVNVGTNRRTTVRPGEERELVWYAGTLESEADGTVVATPIEFGATNLIPADTREQGHKGLFGALIIEPPRSTWSFPVPGTRATADVRWPQGHFREFVAVTQNDLNLYLPDGTPVSSVGGNVDAEDSGSKAINYRTEPLWTRLGYAPETPPVQEEDEDPCGTGSSTDPGGGGGDGGLGGGHSAITNDIDFSDAFSEVTGPIETPIFEAPVGTPIRFRILQAAGHPRNISFGVHGHTWRHEPSNPDSDLVTVQPGHGPASHWDFIPLHGAGGAMGIAGDYLVREHGGPALEGGMFAVLRVVDAPADGSPCDPETGECDCHPSTGACDTDPTPRTCLPALSALSRSPVFQMNVVALRDYTGSMTIGGPLAAGGRIQASNFNIGAAAGGTGPTLVAGGDLELSKGQIHGNARYRGTLTQSGVTVTGGTLAEGDAIDFDAATVDLQDTSDELRRLEPTGTVTQSPNGTLTLSGSSTTLNVFSVDAAAFGKAARIDVVVPPEAVTVVNVTGGFIDLPTLTVSAPDMPSENLLVNFHEAYYIMVRKVTARGTLMAPRATVNFIQADLAGRLLAEFIVGDGQAAHVPPQGPVGRGVCP